jgi:hypothetical protein
MLVGRVEHAYQEIAAGRPSPLTARELAGTRLTQAHGQHAGYDQQAVDLFLASARGDLERVEAWRG